MGAHRKDEHRHRAHRRRHHSSSSSTSSSASTLSSGSSHSERSASSGRSNPRRRRRHRSDERYTSRDHHRRDGRHGRREDRGGHGSKSGRRGLLSISDSSDSERDEERPISPEGTEGLLGFPSSAPPPPPILDEPILGDVGCDTDDDAVDDSLPPRADWVCGVCSNLNSVHRADCYRCSISYARSCRAYPSAEVVIRDVLASADLSDPTSASVSASLATPATPPPARNAEEAERLVLSALGVALEGQRETLDPTAVVSRGRSVYVRLPSIEAATKVLMLCRCALNLGEPKRRCIMEFSSKAVTCAAGSQGAGILEEPVTSPTVTGLSTDALGTGGGAAADPALVGVPRELWPSEWQPPKAFASAEEERRYLALLSDHWSILSAKQRAYYDDGVKRALAQSEAEGRERTEDSASEGAEPPSSSSGTATATSPSSLSDIKKRLAERKAALTAKAGSGAAQAGTPPSPSSSSSEPQGSGTSAVSSLKQRLAQKKAQLANAGTQQQRQQQQQQQDPPGLPAASTGSQGETRCVFGFPVPPSDEADSKETDTRVVVKGVPLDVAGRVIPPTLLVLASRTTQMMQ